MSHPFPNYTDAVHERQGFYIFYQFRYETKYVILHLIGGISQHNALISFKLPNYRSPLNAQINTRTNRR